MAVRKQRADKDYTKVFGQNHWEMVLPFTGRKSLGRVGLGEIKILLSKLKMLLNIQMTLSSRQLEMVTGSFVKLLCFYCGFN